MGQSLGYIKSIFSPDCHARKNKRRPSSTWRDARNKGLQILERKRRSRRRIGRGSGSRDALADRRRRHIEERTSYDIGSPATIIVCS